MEKKYAYQCDQNGYFIGMSERQHSPAEPGTWLIPGGAVLIEPPAIKSGQRAKFIAESQTWTLEEIPAPKVVEHHFKKIEHAVNLEDQVPDLQKAADEANAKAKAAQK